MSEVMHSACRPMGNTWISKFSNVSTVLSTVEAPSSECLIVFQPPCIFWHPLSNAKCYSITTAYMCWWQTLLEKVIHVHPRKQPEIFGMKAMDISFQSYSLHMHILNVRTFVVPEIPFDKTRKPSCRWQTRATLAKSLHGLRKSSGVVSCIARLPIDSLPMVSCYVLYSNYL